MERSFHFSVFSWFLFASTIAGIWLFFLLHRNRKEAPEAAYLAFACLSVSQWAFSNIFENAGKTYALKLLWSQISYFGIAATPLLFFLFALKAAGMDRRLTRRNILIAALLPFLSVVMAFTNESHKLLWSSIVIQEESFVAIYGHGPLFWLFIAYDYLLVISGLLVFITAMTRFPTFYRFRNLVLLVGFVLPLLGNVLYVFKLNPVPGIDWAPIFFIFSCFLFTAAVLKLHIFDVAPVARSTLIETMPDGLLVLDDKNRVLDLNPAMKNLLGGTEEDRIGKPAEEVLAAWPEFLEALKAPSEGALEISRSLGEDRLFFDLRITSLFLSRSRLLTGRFVAVRDITKRKRLEGEKEALIEELKHASTQVSTLQGLLPICSACKKIRDDKGAWQSMEAYLGDRSQVEFTHGLCPECLERYVEKKSG